VAAVQRNLARTAIVILLSVAALIGVMAGSNDPALPIVAHVMAGSEDPALPVFVPLTVTANAPTAHPGDVVVLTIAGANASETVRVHAFGHDIPTFAATAGKRRALVGIDLDLRLGTQTIAVAADDRRATSTIQVVRRAFATRKLIVDPAFVNPPASELSRIDRERAQLEKLWETWTPEKLWDGAFEPPVPEPANSAFGTRSILNGELRSPHGGADFPSAAGTPIKAPNGGRVVLAEALYFTGNTVVVDHGLGLYSLFAHMTEMKVHASDTVRTGDVLGTVGSTGRVTGPHLHWAVRLDGARVDPLVLIRVSGL
jgi:murein DD-endopeptidase MepM/ murein hydrolase activator NlpD